MFKSIYTYSYFYIAQILADVSNLKKNYYVDLIFLFYLLNVCSYLYKLWGIVSTLYYLVVIQSDKERKETKLSSRKNSSKGMVVCYYNNNYLQMKTMFERQNYSIKMNCKMRQIVLMKTEYLVRVDNVQLIKEC